MILADLDASKAVPLPEVNQDGKNAVRGSQAARNAVSIDGSAIPLSLIESWLRIEADRGISETWKPDSITPPMGDSRVHQADELRAWWIVHCAMARVCAPHEPQVLKSLVVHVHYRGLKPSQFWLSGIGVRGWRNILEKLYGVIHEVAAVTPYDKFWEEE